MKLDLMLEDLKRLFLNCFVKNTISFQLNEEIKSKPYISNLFENLVILFQEEAENISIELLIKQLFYKFKE